MFKFKKQTILKQRAKIPKMVIYITEPMVQIIYFLVNVSAETTSALVKARRLTCVTAVLPCAKNKTWPPAKTCNFYLRKTVDPWNWKTTERKKKIKYIQSWCYYYYYYYFRCSKIISIFLSSQNFIVLHSSEQFPFIIIILLLLLLFFFFNIVDTLSDVLSRASTLIQISMDYSDNIIVG